jgi:hypothetical protein
LKFVISAIIHRAFGQTILKLELVPIISVILFCTGTISKPGKHTVNTVIYMMRKIHIGKSADTLALKHVIARCATKGGTKRAMNASVRKGGKSKITAERVTTSVFTAKSGL